jgi:hypothetical protein
MKLVPQSYVVFSEDNDAHIESYNKAKEIIDNIVEDFDKINSIYKKYAAKELLETANEWKAGTVEDASSMVEITEEEFISKLIPDMIRINMDFEEGEIEIGYSDSGMFFGHEVMVSGKIYEPDFAHLFG